MKNNFKKELVSWIVTIGAAFVVSLIIITFLFRITVVKGDSMNNTLFNNDVLFVNKIIYRIDTPKRGDIVICNYPNSDKNYIKRIIGVPGDTIEIHNSKVIINGDVSLDKWNGEHKYNDKLTVVLGEDEYFVMGDNRSNSKDSRSHDVGPINSDDISGRVDCRLMPLNRIGLINK